jgi:hypothetical protein
MFIFIISTLQYLKMVILLKIFTWTRWINHTKMHIRFRKDLHVKKKKIDNGTYVFSIF